MTMRLGMYGGTFDPIHWGHLLLAECCRESAELDEVWFVPAATSPHKLGQSSASATHRWEMLQLATRDHRSFRLCDAELRRGGVSYTVDTLEWLHRERPGDEWFLLMGADSLVDLPRWRSPERICELALPLVVRRPGAEEPNYDRLAGLMSAERLDSIRSHSVPMPLLEISSREIRQRVAAGNSVRYRMPREVESYIHSQALYQ